MHVCNFLYYTAVIARLQLIFIFILVLIANVQIFIYTKVIELEVIYMSTFPQRLRKLLDEREMTAADLSHLTGISKSTISRYLSGKIIAKQINLFKISQALHVDPGALFPDFDKSVDSTSMPFSPAELSLIKKYRRLDDVGKATVNAVIDVQLQRLHE